MALFASKPIILTEYIIFPGRESWTVCSVTVYYTDIFLKKYTYGNLYINDKLNRTTASGYQEQSTKNWKLLYHIIYMQFEVHILSKFENLKMIKINDKNLSNRNRNRSKVLKTEFNKIYVLHPKKLSDIKMSGYWCFPNIIRTTFIFSLIILHNEYMWMTCRSHMFIFFWCHENLSFESGMILSEHAFFNFSWFNHFWPKGWWAKSPKIFNAPVTPVWATTNEIKIIYSTVDLQLDCM